MAGGFGRGLNGMNMSTTLRGFKSPVFNYDSGAYVGIGFIRSSNLRDVVKSDMHRNLWVEPQKSSGL